MPQKTYEIQPGAILHDAIVGTFRAHGRSFEAWCHENGHTPSTVRNATFGQSRGPKGRELLEKIIDGAGRDFVLAAYARRIAEHVQHVQKLKKGAA